MTSKAILRESLLVALAGASTSALAQTPIPLTITGDEARGTITLPGEISAELTITFESVVGLTPTALDASASLVDPLDPTLIGRLPGLVSAPVAFPVLVRIAPSAASALTFEGVVKVSLHTCNLELDPGLPLALHKSPDGGPFQDITTAEAMGSYRVSGSSGTFSEFLIVIDGRPIDAVVVGKFDALQAILTGNAAAMPVTVVSTLQSLLSEARELYDAGTTPAAISKMTAFSAFVKAHSGEDIPDVWRANDPTRVNVAGLLRSGADTLKFSLGRKAGG